MFVGRYLKGGFVAKATLSYYEAGGTHINTTREKSSAIIAKLVEFGVNFKTSYLDRIGRSGEMQIIITGGGQEAEDKALISMRDEGLLETESEEDRRRLLL